MLEEHNRYLFAYLDASSALDHLVVEQVSSPTGYYYDSFVLPCHVLQAMSALISPFSSDKWLPPKLVICAVSSTWAGLFAHVAPLALGFSTALCRNRCCFIVFLSTAGDMRGPQTVHHPSILLRMLFGVELTATRSDQHRLALLKIKNKDFVLLRD